MFLTYDIEKCRKLRSLKFYIPFLKGKTYKPIIQVQIMHGIQMERVRNQIQSI